MFRLLHLSQTPRAAGGGGWKGGHFAFIQLSSAQHQSHCYGDCSRGLLCHLQLFTMFKAFPPPLINLKFSNDEPTYGCVTYAKPSVDTRLQSKEQHHYTTPNGAIKSMLKRREMNCWHRPKVLTEAKSGLKSSLLLLMYNNICSTFSLNLCLVS